MDFKLVALCAAATSILAACPGPNPPPPPQPAAVISFSADKIRIAPGETVTLRFTTRDADEVQLIDQRGELIPIEGTAAEGTATVTPEVTSFYVLKAISQGGRDAAYAQVTVGEDLEEVSLVAVPSHVAAGEQTHLIWTAFNATAARIMNTAGERIDLDVGATASGMAVVTPSGSTTYTLTATAQDGQTTMTASTAVQVSPVLKSFAATPYAARPGEEIVLKWATAGAAQVTIEERLFGELLQTSIPEEVAAGELTWTIPLALPGGAPTPDGTPLEFTIVVAQSDPQEVLTQSIRGYVGEGPVVDFVAPDALTEGKDLLVSWSTRHAVRVQLRVDGLAVYEPRPQNAAEVADGEYAIKGISRDSVVELEVWDYTGASRVERRPVQVVSAPAVGTFTASSPIAEPTSGTTVQWTSTGAFEVAIRALGGPVIYSTRDPQNLAQGRTNVFVAQTTELVLEVWNRAGDRAEAVQTVEVLAPADFTVGPSPVLAGQQVTALWNLDSATTAGVVGVPDGVTPTPQQDPAAFIELDGDPAGREVVFSDSDEAVARLRLRLPFRFPFAGLIRDAFFVSTNGFLAFERTQPLAANQDLTATSGAPLPAMIAPFWDDLRMGSGKVLYALVGSGFPRTLVVEWKNVSLKTEDGKVTFQLQLEETGAFRFVYGPGSGADAAAENATIGVRSEGGALTSKLSHDAGVPVIAPDDAVEWFASGNLYGGFQLSAERTSHYSFFTRTQTGDLILHLQRVQAFASGDVVISEAMPLPASLSPDGRWIELFNATEQDMNLEGLELASTTGSHVLPRLVLPAGAYLLLGQSQDTGASDGVEVQYVYNNIEMGAADTLQLTLDSVPLSTLSWTQAENGKAITAPERAINAAGTALDCPPTSSFGAMSIGTPGKANDRCFEYDLQSIPGAFEDISALGTPLPASPSYGSIPLAVPFRYFGQYYDDVRYSTTAGFVSFSAPLTATSTTGKTKPTSSAPKGTVAPFWDYVVKPSGVPANVYVLRRPGYTVISWQQYIVSGGTNGSLNFQVKLFDSGVIEFHYGEMRASTVTSKADYESGVSATTWIERPAGDAALAVNINTAGGIRPWSGYRFTPRQ